MSRIRLIIAGLAATLVVAAPTTAMGPTKLTGTVGPGFTITLTKGGKRVTTLKAGKYRVVVNDKSGFHSFHLKGPGFNRTITGVAFTGTKAVTVTLKQGRFTYFCDPHRSLKGAFRVT